MEGYNTRVNVLAKELKKVREDLDGVKDMLLNVLKPPLLKMVKEYHSFKTV